MSNYKKPIIFTLIMLPFSFVGAYFAALMTLSQYDSGMVGDALAQFGNNRQLLALASTIQPAAIAIVCAFFGYILAEKVGLMKPFGFESKPLIKTLIISLVGGAVLSLDAWTFAKWIPQVADSYKSYGTFDAVTWIASVLYGGVIEEIMLRLFLMSLLVYLAKKLFFKNEETAPEGAVVAANIIAALVFAAGHLPSTSVLFGTITPMIVFRCFLLNGAFGIVFGHLYRRHGIQYAILAHMLLHIVSRTIWLIAS